MLSRLVIKALALAPEEGGAGPTMGSIADTRTPKPEAAKAEAPKGGDAPKPSGDEKVEPDLAKVFEDIAGEDLGTVGDEELPPLTPKKPKTPQAPKPEVTPETPPVAEKPKSEEVPPKTETPPKVEAKKEDTPPVIPPKVEKPAAETSEELKNRLAKERSDAIAELTKHYEIPEADQAVLVTEPEKVLPRILAEHHAKVVEHAMRVVQSQLPQWLEAMQNQAATARSYSDKFFSEWPELNKPEYHGTVARVLQGYRAANPEAKPEDVIREGGVTAIVALRLPIPDRVARMHNADKPDETKPRTVQSSAMSSGTPPAPKPKSDNTFTVIAEEDLTDS